MYFNILNKKKVVVKKVAIEITKKFCLNSAFSAKANQFDAEGAKVVEVTDATWNSNPVHNLGTAFNGISDPDNSIIDHNYIYLFGKEDCIQLNSE